MLYSYDHENKLSPKPYSFLLYWICAILHLEEMISYYKKQLE